MCADFSYVFVCSLASQRHGNKCSPRDTPGSVGSTYDHPYPTLLTRRNGSNYSYSSPDGEHSSWWWIAEPFRRNWHQNYFEVRFLWERDRNYMLNSWITVKLCACNHAGTLGEDNLRKLVEWRLLRVLDHNDFFFNPPLPRCINF